MAYHHYMDQGRFPAEIHDMDVLDYLRICLWKMADMHQAEAPRQAHIEDFI